jgi:hypothetical protein
MNPGVMLPNCAATASSIDWSNIARSNLDRRSAFFAEEAMRSPKKNDDHSGVGDEISELGPTRVWQRGGSVHVAVAHQDELRVNAFCKECVCEGLVEFGHGRDSAAQCEAAASLSCVFVSKSLASWRSWS